jgi:hypothetical protein
MMPAPVVLGMHLCRRVVFAGPDGRFTLQDVFWRIRSDAFPALAEPFFAFATLKGGAGPGTIYLAAYRLDTGRLVHSVSEPISFTDRLQAVHVPILFSNCVFPAAGEYEFELRVDWDILAQQRAYVTFGDDP